MSRFLLLMLLLALPLQSVLAGAGNYCQHEVGVSSKHFGHHAHEHQQSHPSDATLSGSGGLDAHADCGSCTAGSLLALTTLSTVVLLSPSRAPGSDGSTFSVARIADRPERPKWTAAA